MADITLLKLCDVKFYLKCQSGAILYDECWFEMCLINVVVAPNLRRPNKRAGMFNWHFRECVEKGSAKGVGKTFKPILRV